VKFDYIIDYNIFIPKKQQKSKFLFIFLAIKKD